jgi:hypothetical protein
LVHLVDGQGAGNRPLRNAGLLFVQAIVVTGTGEVLLCTRWEGCWCV